MYKGPERRTEEHVRRANRLGLSGLGILIGVPAATLLAWWWDMNHDEAMPAGVEAAIGSVVTSCMVCLGDIRYILYRKLRIKEREL